MTWLTWRLHRSEAALGLVLFSALIAIIFLATGAVDTANNAALDGNCFENGEDQLCGQLVNDYFTQISRWGNLSTLLHGVPLAAAALIIIPTLHEFERGTHRLAWTQSISRRRWALSRFGFAAAIGVAITVVWAFVAAHWRSSLMNGAGQNFGQDYFELSPIVLFGYGLFAIALGLAAAVLVRRLIPTLALLGVGFIGTRIFTTFELRERYRAPITEIVPAASDAGPYTWYPDRWILDESWLTRSGARISWEDVNQLCLPQSDAQNTEEFYRKCLIDNGLQYFRSYHPNDRFMQFQLIETAIYLGLAAALFAGTYWWLTRRPA